MQFEPDSGVLAHIIDDEVEVFARFANECYASGRKKYARHGPADRGGDGLPLFFEQFIGHEIVAGIQRIGAAGYFVAVTDPAAVAVETIGIRTIDLDFFQVV